MTYALKALRRATWKTLAVVLILCGSAESLRSWGSRTHRVISENAAAALPDGMRQFFLQWRDSLNVRSIEPDRRRSVDPAEQFRHYINIDYYGPYPFTELPRSFEAAAQKFGQGTLDSIGTLPWRIAEITDSLSAAMRRGDEEQIVLFAGYLSHYVGDANVPLHTVLNYDGQRTGQKGIHARWESHLPSRYGDAYVLEVPKPGFIADPLARAFLIVETSFLKADSVLAADTLALSALAEGDRFRTVVRNGQERLEYSDAYYEQFRDRLNGMVERQTQAAIQAVSDYWLTAWEMAGRPVLPLREVLETVEP